MIVIISIVILPENPSREALLFGKLIVGALLFRQALRPFRLFASPRVCSGGPRKLCEAQNAMCGGPQTTAAEDDCVCTILCGPFGGSDTDAKRLADHGRARELLNATRTLWASEQSQGSFGGP